MLNCLTIKNVALIDNVKIQFNKGLNVLSGETGSGKSVILESLNFVLGAKAEKSMIRHGENECFVSAEFDVSGREDIKSIYDSLDLEYDEILLITRKFNLDGKSTVKINGETVTLSMVRKFTSFLVDVHGQSEHFYLLKNSNQLDLLDKLGGNLVYGIKENLKNTFYTLKDLISSLNEFGGTESERENKLDLINYQINEIEKADLKLGEDENLSQIKEKLNNQEKILSSLSTLKSCISDEGCALDVLSGAERAISNISNYSQEYNSLLERVSSVVYELEDISQTAQNRIEDFDYAEVDPEYVEERLDLIKKLKRKYGDTIEEVFSFLDNAVIERDKLLNYQDCIEKINKDILDCKKDVYSIYKQLSDARKDTALEFSKHVITTLKELSISNAEFKISFTEEPSFDECKFFSSNGFDEIDFEFSANAGEPLKKLSEVISGGEMSRFMLAIKTLTAKHNNISTFVFDEIDAGISGVVAKNMAQKFYNLSLERQIIAITHLPQISSMADNNVLIEKVDENGKTKTIVSILTDDEKVNEIVRLSGGDVKSNTSIMHAKELINNALEYKKSIKSQT